MSMPSNEQAIPVQPVAHSQLNMLDVKDVARRLKIVPLTVYRMVARGALPVYRVGGRRMRFKVDDVDRYLERNKSYGGS